MADDYYAKNPAGMAGVFPAGSQRKKVTYSVVNLKTGVVLGEFNDHKSTQTFLNELNELYPNGNFGVDIDPPDHDWRTENG